MVLKFTVVHISLLGGLLLQGNVIFAAVMKMSRGTLPLLEFLHDFSL